MDPNQAHSPSALMTGVEEVQPAMDANSLLLPLVGMSQTPLMSYLNRVQKDKAVFYVDVFPSRFKIPMFRPLGKTVTMVVSMNFFPTENFGFEVGNNVLNPKGSIIVNQGDNTSPIINVDPNLLVLPDEPYIIAEHQCGCNIEGRHFGWVRVPMKQLINKLHCNESVDYQMNCPFGMEIGTVRFSHVNWEEVVKQHVMDNSDQERRGRGRGSLRRRLSAVGGWIGRAAAHAVGGCVADAVIED